MFLAPQLLEARQIHGRKQRVTIRICVHEGEMNAAHMRHGESVNLPSARDDHAVRPHAKPDLLPPGQRGIDRMLDRDAFLAELGIALPVGIGQVHDLVRLLSNHIIQVHQEGRRLIVIIDEAHLLSADCLHVVRTISNIETPEQKLSTCLLLGESRLAQRLEHPTFESLRNRIYLRSTLDSLSVEETEQYLKFRLLTAGRFEDLFTPASFQAMHAHSGGIARSLNKIAMLSLLEGSMRQRPMIDEEVVAAAAKRL